MHLLSLKKSTLSLKQSFIRQTHRFSSSTATTSSPKKHDQYQEHHKHPTGKSKPPLSFQQQQQHHFDIVVIETSSVLTVTDNSKKKRQQRPLTLFNIIVEDADKHLSLVRFITDIIELDQLFKKYYGVTCKLPPLPILTDSSATKASTTPSSLHIHTLRRLFSKFKSKKKKTNGEKLELWLRSCASHPVLGKSSLLRDFLSPQRDEDNIITKAAIHSLVQQQAFYDQSSATVAKPSSSSTTTIPTTLHIALTEQQKQQQQQPELDQSPSIKPIHALSTIDESAFSLGADLTDAHYAMSDIVFDPSSSSHYGGMESSLTSSRFLGEDSDDEEDINKLTSLFPLPPPAPSPLNVSSTMSYPLLMSPSKLACCPPLGQERSAPPPRLASTKPIPPTHSEQLAKSRKHQPTRMTLDDLQFLKVLGKGCMGKVILVRHHQSARLYALKAISKDWVITQREIEHAVMERNILSKVSRAHHPFLIKLHHSFQNANQLFLVMDYHVGSDLATQLQLHYYFNPDRCRFYIAEILLGLQELHRLGILYRDLKPENILLAADGHVVLTDFGFSRLFDEGEEQQQYDVLDNNRRLPYHTRTFCGTPHYMSPEIFLSEEYTYAVDYWSLGVVMYEMLLGCTPFDADNDAELYRRVLEDPVDIPENIPPATADLILGLLERNPEDRIGCASFFDSSDSDSDFYPDSMVGQKDIRQHPYFDGLDWSDVYNKRLPAPFVPRLKSDTDVSHFDPDFVKLSPRLSVTHRYEDDLDDLDDDPYGLDPEAYDSKTWANRYNNKHGGGFDDDDDQIPLDQAFIGYSYINEDTCVDTDSLLDEDEDKESHDVAFTHGQHINDDNNSAPLMAHDSTRLVVLEGNHRASHYYDSPCPAIITSPATTVASTPMASSYHYYHQQQQLTVPEKGLSAKPGLPSSSQQLGFSRFQRRHDQQQVRLSSSFTLTSLQSDSDDVVWLQ